MKREDINKKYKWDLESMYSDDESWEEHFNYIDKKIDQFKNYKDKLADDSNTLISALKLNEEISRGVYKLYSYANLKSDEDTRISKNTERKDKAFGLYVKANTEMSYFIPELLKKRCRISEFVKYNKELNIYKHFFHNIFRNEAHTLNEEMEVLLAKTSELGNSPSNIFTMLDNADMKFQDILDCKGEKHKLTHGSYILLLESNDRVLRENAFRTMYGEYKALENTFAAILNGELKANKFYSEVRNYNSTIEKALFNNNIDIKVYDNLIESVHNNLNSFHKYMGLLKESLNLDELNMYDIYTNIVDSLDMKFPYEKGVETILEGLKPLGEDYIKILEEGFNSRWVDVYENKGKRSGGYSGGCYDSMPYILMNYKDNLNSVFTLAHEMGHSIHSYLSRKNQPYIYSSYSIFVAEVASTVNEILLINYFLENVKSIEEKLYFTNYYLNSFRATVYRQTMFCEFEKLINEHLENTSSVSVDYLNEKYYDLNKLYFGDNVNINREIESEWARIPHFYYNFYVYQYATGFSAAVYIADKILNKEEGFLERYIEFLSTGSSKYPLDALKDLGLDMTTGDVVDKALEIFNKYVNNLEELLDNRKR